MLLRSDGEAVACGHNDFGQCDIPPLDAGLSYVQVSAGGDHTVLLRSDGTAVACGHNRFGQCRLPPLDAGLSYIQVSAGGYHTVLLRSDGEAVACGHTGFGHCEIPPLDAGLSYIQACGGVNHTVLLRSDGEAVACGAGANSFGRCDVPLRKDYVCDLRPREHSILQLETTYEADAVTLSVCSACSGDEMLCLNIQSFVLAWDIHKQIARELRMALQGLHVVLPNGQLLAKVCRANPGATVADIADRSDRAKRSRHA